VYNTAHLGVKFGSRIAHLRISHVGMYFLNCPSVCQPLYLDSPSNKTNIMKSNKRHTVTSITLDRTQTYNNQSEQSHIVRHILPTLIHLATVLVEVVNQTLGETVGPHKLGRDRVDVNIFLVNVIPKPMPLHKVVLGAIGDSVSHCKQVGRIVVLKGTTMDGGMKRWSQADGKRDFDEKRANGQECAKALAQSIVLSFSGGETDLGLQLGLPNERNVTESDDVAGARLDTGWTGIRIAAKPSHEVTIAMVIQL
jgi:hypothetical protein